VNLLRITIVHRKTGYKSLFPIVKTPSMNSKFSVLDLFIFHKVKYCLLGSEKIQFLSDPLLF